MTGTALLMCALWHIVGLFCCVRGMQAMMPCALADAKAF